MIMHIRKVVASLKGVKLRKISAPKSSCLANTGMPEKRFPVSVIVEVRQEDNFTC